MTEKKMLSDYPKLVNEWDYEKNIGLDPHVESFSGRTKIWWKCSLNHSWMSILSNRIKGSQCPYCSGSKILAGFNDVFTVSPELIKEWDFQRNNEIKIDPLTLGIGNHAKVWWKCSKEFHSYESSVASRIRGRSCPYCSNKKVLVGFNDLATHNPELLEEWDYEKNSLKPEDITPGSDKEIYWICNKKHSYLMSAQRRTNKSNSRGCSVCTGKNVVRSTSILDMPEILKFWDFDRNKVDPMTVLPGSNKKYWWVFDCGHSCQKSPKSIKNGSKCPYCAVGNTQLLEGYNDLATKAPNLVAEWSENNKNLLPSNFLSGSKKKVWWKCQKDHEWQAVIDNRYRRVASCPQCSSKGTSKLEKEVQNFIRSILPGSISVVFNSYQIIKPQELDIYIPEKRIAIEFNGLYWHSEATGKDRNYHYDKWKKCQDQGIQLITIWEDDWRNNRKIVESMLKHKIGFSDNMRVYARKTYAKLVDNFEAKNFLNYHHIQGFKNITKSFGLFDKSNDVLVAVISFSVDKNVASLDRYATSFSVVGGFTKLLNYAVNEIRKSNSEIDIITTFADHEVSDGGLYKKNGFIVDSHVKPDYKYIYKNQRCHKFLFRKKRFEKDSDLVFDENMTEKELADVNNIYRVWDCGKTKYVKKV